MSAPGTGLDVHAAKLNAAPLTRAPRCRNSNPAPADVTEIPACAGKAQRERRRHAPTADEDFRLFVGAECGADSRAPGNRGRPCARGGCACCNERLGLCEGWCCRGSPTGSGDGCGGVGRDAGLRRRATLGTAHPNPLRPSHVFASEGSVLDGRPVAHVSVLCTGIRAGRPRSPRS
jgi:hypothetical protein